MFLPNLVPFPPADYLCSPEENVYKIDFTRFKIRDMESGTVLFEITKPPASGEWMECGEWMEHTFTYLVYYFSEGSLAAQSYVPFSAGAVLLCQPNAVVNMP